LQQKIKRVKKSRPLLVGSESDECSGSSEVGEGPRTVGLAGRRDYIQAQSQVKRLAVITQPDQINIETLIEKTVKTINRKRLNVVESGFHDSGSEENDKALFINLCGDYLRLVSNILHCVRLKGSVSSHGPQKVRVHRHPLLLVTLSSLSQVDDILSRTRLLRNVDDETVSREVYLSKDLTMEEAKLAFNKRVAKQTKVTSNVVVQSSALSASSPSFIPKTQSLVVQPDEQMLTNTVPDADTVLIISGRPDN